MKVFDELKEPTKKQASLSDQIRRDTSKKDTVHSSKVTDSQAQRLSCPYTAVLTLEDSISTFHLGLTT